MWDFSVIIIRFIGDMRYYIFFVNTIGCNWYGSYHNYVYDGVDWLRRLVGPSTMVVGGTSMILVRKTTRSVVGSDGEGPWRWIVDQRVLKLGGMSIRIPWGWGVYLDTLRQSSQYVLKVRGTWLECLNLDRGLAL
jgi:hypothetical protein